MRPGDDIAAIYDIQPPQPGEKRLRAAFVVLAQNRDAPDVVLSMTRLLRRFNNTDTRFVVSSYGTAQRQHCDRMACCRVA